MKKLSVKVGEYKGQDGQMKGKYVNVGVLMNNESGEYVLLDPNVCLAGLLASQNVMASNKNEQLRDRVMCGVFEDQPVQQQGNNQNHQQNQQQYQGQQQQGVYNQQQGGYNNR